MKKIQRNPAQFCWLYGKRTGFGRGVVTFVTYGYGWLASFKKGNIDYSPIIQ